MLGDFSGFFQKNVTQVVFFKIDFCSIGHRDRCDCNRSCQSRHDHSGFARAAGGNSQRSFLSRPGQVRLPSQRGLGGQRVKLRHQLCAGCACICFVGDVCDGVRQRYNRGAQWLIHQRRSFFRSAHHWPEFAGDVVVNEKFFGQNRLVIQHVDQKAQGTDVVAELIKGAGSPGQLFIYFGFEHSFNAVPHPQDRLGGLVKAQHRQYTAHLCQLARYVPQDQFVFGIPEKCVKRFFKVAERNTQLAHHATHGLFVADTPVKVFHPRLKGLRISTVFDTIEPRCKVPGTNGKLRIIGIQILKCGFQIQNRSSNFHRQFDRRSFAGSGGKFNCTRQ